MLDNSPAATEAKQQIIDDLLQELPSDNDVEVELPSEGKIYTLPNPAAPITLRPMTFDDEKHIVSAKKSADPVNLILSRCVSNLNINEIIAIDKLYLIMKLREISYGDDYNTMLICKSCDAENPSIIKLSELNINPVPDDFTDPIEITLPTLGKKAKIRIPRVKDERYLKDAEEALDRLWRFVEDIDGHTDKSIIAAVIEKLPVKDSRSILNAMKTDFGVDTKVKLKCTSCGEVSVVDLPIDANFFDVN